MIDLKPFCETDVGLRYDLSTPFYIDGYTYATNGHIIVRIPGQFAESRENVPPVTKPKMSWNHSEILIWLPLPNCEIKKIGCQQCEGGGFTVHCLECNGKGYIETPYNEYDCKKCDTFGVLAGDKEDGQPCSDCNGTGEVIDNKPIPFLSFKPVRGNSYGIASKYIALMRTLPDCQLSGIEQPGDEPLPFIFDGGQGLIMGILKGGLNKCVNFLAA